MEFEKKKKQKTHEFPWLFALSTITGEAFCIIYALQNFSSLPKKKKKERKISYSMALIL